MISTLEEVHSACRVFSTGTCLNLVLWFHARVTGTGAHSPPEAMALYDPRWETSLRRWQEAAQARSSYRLSNNAPEGWLHFNRMNIQMLEGWFEVITAWAAGQAVVAKGSKQYWKGGVGPCAPA